MFSYEYFKIFKNTYVEDFKFDFLSMLMFIIRHCFLRAFSLTVFMKFTQWTEERLAFKRNTRKKYTFFHS